METKKTKKKRKLKNKKIEYYCECCDYSTSKKTDFNRHLLTKKHQRMKSGVFLMPASANC